MSKTVIETAREAGIYKDGFDQWVALNFTCLERFAALVAAQEREECAKVCENIAAMRCYVASKLGETVEVPDEL